MSELDPWAEPSPGEALLDDVHAFLCRFVAFPSVEAGYAVTLWAAHCHTIDAFDSTPRLALLSPEPGSGKSRVLEVLELLVPRPLFSMNTSAAALFRTVASDDGVPTVLIDEADTIFGPRSAKDHEDIRGFVNAGHRRGASAQRCTMRGQQAVVETFPAFAAVALAGLDDLPDTIMTRSVVVRMRRRAPHERVEPFRLRLHRAAGEALAERLSAWCLSAVDEHLREHDWPDLPEGIEDRSADVWEGLLTIADAAGGRWPELARVAAVALVADARRDGGSLGVRLLTDLRELFQTSQAEHLSTEAIVNGLLAMDESPWGDLRGKPLDARGLARRLKKYDVHPTTVRIADKTPKGYRLEDLHDTFSRYLPAPVALVVDVLGGWSSSDFNKETAASPASPEISATSATSATDYPDCYNCGEPLDPAVELLGRHEDCAADL